jgi:heat shock protein HslJ
MSTRESGDMKSYLVLGIICVFLAVLVTGCTQPVTLPVTTPPTTAVPATLPPTPAPTNDPSLLLKSATWSLSSMVKNSTTVPILPGTIITAKFTADSVDGVAGCNNYFASYTVSGNTMTIGPVGSTRMFCGEPVGLMAQENAYIGMLQTAATYSVTATELIISDAGGKNQLVYQKYQPPGITGKWQLDSIGQGSTVSRIIAGTNITAVFASDGNLTGSAGCNNYFTRFRVEADGVTITSPIGTTLMFCSEPGGVMTQESTYLSILQNVTKYSTINNQLNLMDEGGKNTLFFIAMQG